MRGDVQRGGGASSISVNQTRSLDIMFGVPGPEVGTAAKLQSVRHTQVGSGGVGREPSSENCPIPSELRCLGE